MTITNRVVLAAIALCMLLTVSASGQEVILQGKPYDAFVKTNATTLFFGSTPVAATTPIQNIKCPKSSHCFFRIDLSTQLDGLTSGGLVAGYVTVSGPGSIDVLPYNSLGIDATYSGDLTQTRGITWMTGTVGPGVYTVTVYLNTVVDGATAGSFSRTLGVEVYLEH